MLRGTRRALLGGKRLYYKKVLSYNPTAYWPLWETSGTVAECLNNSALNGTYTTVTLGNAAGPDGSPCPLFDGTDSRVAIPVNGVMNLSAGTAMGWMKVSAAGIWTDGVIRYLMRLETNTSNYVRLYKHSTNNTVALHTNFGGTFKGLNPGSTSVDWIFAAVTWDKTADEIRGYYNGAQVSPTLTGLGTWSAQPGVNFIGAASASANVFSGWLAQCAIWTRALTPAEVADLYLI